MHSFEYSLKWFDILGDDGMTEYEERINKPAKGAKGKPQKESVADRKLSDDLTRLFRIYFPTHDTVAKSKGGIGVSLSEFSLAPLKISPKVKAFLAHMNHFPTRKSWNQ